MLSYTLHKQLNRHKQLSGVSSFIVTKSSSIAPAVSMPAPLSLRVHAHADYQTQCQLC